MPYVSTSPPSIAASAFNVAPGAPREPHGPEDRSVMYANCDCDSRPRRRDAAAWT